ncbi:MAG: tetratricopeptide repeat protein [Bdellovibrionales bacterium]|nr:tetratricopeptide repeat protein [Bdellovibrionales bacterium]
MFKGHPMSYRNLLSKTKGLILIFFIFVFGLEVYSESINAQPDVQRYKSILDKNPEDIKVRKALANLYFNQKMWKQCENFLVAYKEDLDRNSIFQLAKCQHEQKKYSEEVKTLLTLSPDKKKDLKALYYIGLAYADSNQYPNAITYYKKALQVDGESRVVYEHLLDVFEKTKNIYEQRVLLKEMIKKFESVAPYYHKLCRTYSEEAFVAETIKICSTAIEKDQKHAAESYVYLAQAYIDSKQKDKAKKILKTATKRFKGSEVVFRTMGEFFLNEKDFHSALRYFKTAFRNNDHSARSALGMAKSLFYTGKFEEAYGAFEKACRLDRSTYTDFRTATSRLQQEKKYDLHNKYLKASNRCRMTQLK